MTTIVFDCPRCGVLHSTFDVQGITPDLKSNESDRHLELFSVCRKCWKPTLIIACCNNFNVREWFYSWDELRKIDSDISNVLDVKGFVSVKDNNTRPKPEYLPLEVDQVFDEAMACMSIECWNAASVMLRTALDLATRRLLPDEDTDGLNRRKRRDLGLRLPWLFENGHLPRDLEELSKCIREEGNDGAHQANLTRDDAEDNYDFSFELLKKLFTEPRRIALAEERRLARRAD